MKRFLTVLLSMIFAAPAIALEQASPPPKFPIVWGASAGSSYVRSIPTNSQIGSQNCAASLTDGFPPLTFVPSSAGGCPPFGQDFNGILKQLSQQAQWSQAGGPVFYNSAFASASGGYPSGAMVNSAVTPGTIWMSTADNNTTDPDDGGANWVQAPGQIPIGTPVQTISTTIPSGYVSANGLTIGDASSNATNRANADTKFLFAFVWTNCANATCPIYTSGGVASTRGLTAAADYAAHKAIAVFPMNGTALMGADSQNGTTSSNLLNVPVTSGSRTAPSSVLGENLHALTEAENGTHNHTLTDPGHTHSITNPNNINGLALAISGGFGFGGGGAAQRGIDNANIGFQANSTGVTIAASGSGTAHNTVARSMIVYWNLKL